MSPSLVVRTGRPFAEVAPALRRALARSCRDLPTAGFQPVRRIVDRAMSARRFFVDLLIALPSRRCSSRRSASTASSRTRLRGGPRKSACAWRSGHRAAASASSVVDDTLRLAMTGAVARKRCCRRGVVAAGLAAVWCVGRRSLDLHRAATVPASGRYRRRVCSRHSERRASRRSRRCASTEKREERNRRRGERERTIRFLSFSPSAVSPLFLLVDAPASPSSIDAAIDGGHHV